MHRTFRPGFESLERREVFAHAASAIATLPPIQPITPPAETSVFVATNHNNFCAPQTGAPLCSQMNSSNALTTKATVILPYIEQGNVYKSAAPKNTDKGTPAPSSVTQHSLKPSPHDAIFNSPAPKTFSSPEIQKYQNIGAFDDKAPKGKSIGDTNFGKPLNAAAVDQLFGKNDAAGLAQFDNALEQILKEQKKSPAQDLAKNLDSALNQMSNHNQQFHNIAKTIIQNIR